MLHTVLKYIPVLIISVFLITDICAQENRVGLENKFRLAQTYERSGEPEKAESIYKELLALQPWNQTYLTALNDLYLNQKEYDKSISLLEKSITDNPNDVNKYGLLGTTYYIMSQREKAFETWERALSLPFSGSMNYRIIANYAIQNRAFDEAIDILKRGRESATDPKLFSYDLATIYTASMKFKEATIEYCNILSHDPMQLELTKRRIAAYIDRPGAFEAALDAINQFPDRDNNLVFKELLASVYSGNGRYEDAFNLTIEIDSLSGSNGALLYKFAQEMFFAKQYNVSSRCYKFIISNYPKSPFYYDSKMGYAKTLEFTINKDVQNKNTSWKKYFVVDTTINRKYEQAVTAYKELMNLQSGADLSIEAAYRAAKIIFEKQLQPFKALKLIEPFLNRKTLSGFYTDIMELQGRIYIYLGELQNAEQSFNGAMKPAVNNGHQKNLIKYNLAKIYFWNAEFEKSVNLLNGIANNLRDDIANDALELALIINTGIKDSVNLARFAAAMLDAERMKFDSASVVFDELANDNNLLFLNIMASFMNTEMMIALDQYNRSIEMLQNIIKKDRSGIFTDKAMFLIANVYHFGLSDVPKAAEMYQNILESYPNSLYFDRSRELIQMLNNNGSNI
ncbi:MAG: tetratricopeptide repeat protein [Melioribacteraceae bacterium]|nr:tetratricopeptide repeat protein [Melioribacteraceae bacterium]